MSNLKYMEGYYIGKEFTKGGEGKGDKPGWKLYKLSFKKNMEDEYATKLSAFNSMKGFDTLEEGEYYTIGYEESEPTYNEKAGKEIQYKTAKFVAVKKPGESTPQQQTPTKPKETNVLDADRPATEEEQVFMSDVFTKNEELSDEDNLALFVGKWIMTFTKAASQRPIKLFNELE